jgi:hypothetical protein
MIDPDFISKLDDILRDITQNGDVLTVPMKRLKTLHGAERLKSLVRQSIQDHLSYRQIGFVGHELPASENESVRLYLKGTPVARIIEAVQLNGPRGDQQLRELASTGSAATTQDLVQKLKLVLSQFDESEND